MSFLPFFYVIFMHFVKHISIRLVGLFNNDRSGGYELTNSEGIKILLL